MLRTRLWDFRLSRLPALIGKCPDDRPYIADAVNTAQRRLLYCKEAGEESWWGTWAEIAFNVSRAQPYITLPREIARLEAVNVCDRPVAVQNQFFEYLEFGNGRLPKRFAQTSCCSSPTLVVSRNNRPTFVDLSDPPQFITIFPSDNLDVGKSVIIQGTDSSDNTVYSQEFANRIQGIKVTLSLPFVTTPMPFNTITGIQKDLTNGAVQIMQTDPDTGDQVLLVTMQPSETTGWYRRYYLDQLPCGCCPPPSVPASSCADIQVTAIAKLELVPVMVDTDYTLIQNMEAIIHEAEGVRYSTIDTSEAKQLAAYHHREAVNLLNGELTHYLGRDNPPVGFAPFGSARLERVRIGMI